MASRRSLVIRWVAGILIALLLLVCMGASILINYKKPAPERPYDPHIIQKAELKPVKSAWRFETVYASREIGHPSLALDSRGNAHIAYGGNQLYYAWFDGASWQHEIADARPSAGKEAHLLLDALDQPHIIYEVGFQGYDDSLMLAHAYRGSSGWQTETIDPNFCRKWINQAAFDPQGRLNVVFYGIAGCNPENANSNNIWMAQKDGAEWKISQITEHGFAPSLAYDASGRPWVSFTDHNLWRIDVASWTGENWEIEHLNERPGQYSRTWNLLAPDGTKHIFYTVAPQSDSFSLGHGWKNTTGWWFEEVHIGSPAVDINSAIFDSQGRLNLVVWDKDGWLSLIRHGPGGWDAAPRHILYLQNQYLRELELELDREGRFHLMYIKNEDHSLYYEYQSNPEGQSTGPGWQATLIDQGGSLAGMKSALAFDHNGRLATALQGGDNQIYYLWKEKETWRQEKVAPGMLTLLRYDPIHLYFDQENQPHIFFVGERSEQYSWGNYYHAYRENGRWKTEALPVEINTYWRMSKPQFNPEGWPALFDDGRTSLEKGFLFRYRDPAGWHEQYLPAPQPMVGEGPYPQINYSPRQTPVSTGAGGITLPGFVYITRDSHAVTYFDPLKNQMEVVPILAKNERASHYAFQYDSRGNPVLLVPASIPQEGADPISRSMLYANRDENGWRAYEIDNLILSGLDAPFLDRQDRAHLASGFNYVTGAGLDWKITPIQGAALSGQSEHLEFFSQAVREDGGAFCVEIFDDGANELIIGCLESIE